MSLINTQIKPFKNQAFKDGKFIEVTEKMWLENGVYSSSIQQTLLSFAQLNLVTSLTITKNSKKWALKSIQFQLIPTLLTKHGTKVQKLSVKSNTP